MKRKIVPILCLFMVILGGCSAAPNNSPAPDNSPASDYSEYTYADYAGMAWEEKEIAYQFCSSDGTQAWGKWFPVLVDLYTDGSARITEVSLAPVNTLTGYGRWEVEASQLIVRYYQAADTNVIRIRTSLSDEMVMSVSSRYMDNEIELTGGETVKYNSPEEFFNEVSQGMEYTVKTSLPAKDQYSIAFIGDSITAGAKVTVPERYSSLIEQEPWVSQANNYGIETSTVLRAQELVMEKVKPVQCFVDRPLYFKESSDVAFIFGGTNDFGVTDYPIGNIDDIDDSTFYGALNCLVARISAFYPDSMIIFATPIQRLDKDINVPNSAGYYLKDYRDAVLSICAKYELYCIDLYNFEGMQADDPEFASLLADDLHPNADGHKLLSEKIGAELYAILFE